MSAPNPQDILNYAEKVRAYNEDHEHDDLTRLLHEMAQTILHLHQRLEALEPTTPAPPASTRTPLIYEEQ